MRRYLNLILIACILLLTGCSSDEFMEKKVLLALENAIDNPYPAVNHQKKYYGYYLPKDIGRRKSTKFSEVLEKEGYTIVINFKTRSVVEESILLTTHHKKERTINQEVLSKMLGHISYEKVKHGYIYHGYYQMLDKSIQPFTCKILNNDKNNVAISFTSSYMDGFTIVPKVSAHRYASLLLKMASAFRIDEEKILKDLSLYEAYQNDKESNNHMKEVFGEEGYLVDIGNRETHTPD